MNEVFRKIARARRRRWLAVQIRSGKLSVPSLEEVRRLGAPQLPVGALDRPLER